MPKKHIVILSQTHICRNPRVLKEALTLSNNGFTVTVLTAIHSKTLLEEDFELIGNQINYDFYANLIKKNLRSFTDRLTTKIARKLQSIFNLESVNSLGYGYNRIVKKCKKANADFYIMHQELPLIAGNKLLRKGFKVAFDLEDYYSEDLLPAARKERPINLLKKNECFSLNHATYTTTTSEVMATHFHEEYGGKKPEIIRNVFPLIGMNLMYDNPKEKLKLYWLSQTIGPGRGLSLLIEAVNEISEPLEIHLRGNIVDQYDQKLNKQLQERHQLFYHPLIPNQKIVADMVNYDVGLALEEKEPFNKALTSSNKIFHYLTGSLPVIASDTPGQVEVANFQNNQVIFIFDGTAKGLTSTIDRLLENKKILTTLKRKAYQLAQEQFNWEIEEKKLLKIVKQYLC